MISPHTTGNHNMTETLRRTYLSKALLKHMFSEEFGH